MTLDQESLDLDAIVDERVAAVIRFAIQKSDGATGVRNVLMAVIDMDDTIATQTLTAALRPGFGIDNLRRALDLPWPEDGVQQLYSNTAEPVSSELAKTLLACSRNENEREGNRVSLSALLEQLFSELKRQQRPISSIIDVDLAQRLFRDRRLQLEQGAANPGQAAPDGNSQSADDQPFRLPHDLVLSEDVSYLTRHAHRHGEYPYDLDSQYQKLFEELARAFHRRQARHVFLVGERGVGQSTVVTELARRVTMGRIPFLSGKRILAIDCRYIPCEESRERLAAILAHVAHRTDVVACFDGFGNLLRSDRGRSNKGLLLAALSRSSFRMLGRLTPAEYEDLVADDADMLDFFHRIDVAEPSLETAKKLLRHFSLGLQQRYRISVDAAAIDRSVVLSANYIFNERLPGKALRILHRVCEDIEYERTQLGVARDRVTVDDVIAVVAQISGVPSETLRGIAEKSDYAESLGTMVVGQDSAVREVATELSLIKAGLTDRNKPASVMLFVGQTGTGKTEMAKALARFYSTSKRLRIYTLGNFVESHSVAGLIGVPAGYVGHDQGGRLINELNSDPYCVFLLDEADKAHPDVLQPFLNLFDEGWVRDQRGVQAYANKAIFILTTNVGQRMILDMAKQGKTSEEIAERMKEALGQIRHGKSNRPVFAAEFVARIKRVVVFKPLDRPAMEGICRKLVQEMQSNWRETRRQVLEIPDALIELIAERAFVRNEKSEGREGGRIVRKLISEFIDSPLQREITARTAEYRDSDMVVLELHPANCGGAVPSGPPTLSDPFIVHVQFRRKC